MPFLEERLPTGTSFGLIAGPQFSTDVIIRGSGFEQRNQRWAVPRNIYTFDAKKSKDIDIQELLDFMRSVAFGMFNGFRIKDWTDFNSLTPSQTITKDDIILGTGDSSNTTFQCIKIYNFGSQTFNRTINKLVSNTLLVAADTILQSDPGDYTVDLDTGIITFSTPPAGGVVITAGFEFDVPVRLDGDIQQILGSGGGIYQWRGIKFIELRI